MVLHFRYKLCSSETDPEMPATIAPLQNSSAASATHFNHRSLAPAPAISRTSNSTTSIMTTASPIDMGVAGTCSAMNDVSFDRKPLMSCSTASKMSLLFKPGSSRSQVTFRQNSLTTNVVTGSGVVTRSEPSNETCENNTKPCQLRFWCPKPSKSAIFNKSAAHQHTPPPQILRQRDCMFGSGANSFDDDEEEDDEYYGSSSDEDDYDDQYDESDDLATRLTSCSTFVEDDYIFGSD